MDERGIFENPMEIDCKYSKDNPAVQTHNRKESSHEKKKTNGKTSHEIETNESEQVVTIKKEYNESDLLNNFDRAVSDKASSCETNTVNEVLEDVSMEKDRHDTTGREADVENDKEQEETSRSHEIKQISPVQSECVQCKKVTDCSYMYVDKSDKNRYLCTEMCIAAYRLEHLGFTVTNKKYVIKEITNTKMACSECEKEKYCYFYCHYDGEHTYYCSITCLESMMADEKDKYTFQRQRITIVEMEPKASTCFNCNETKPCTFSFTRYGKRFVVCSMNCVKDIRNKEDCKCIVINCKNTRKSAAVSTQNPSQADREEREHTFIRSCMQCSLILTWESADVLTWETMDFCNEECLEQYLNRYGGKCKKCNNTVKNTCLGKYCTRFGREIYHFCSTVCLEEFKKSIKICCYCQRDISASLTGFMASVSAGEQLKDFCSQNCVEKLVRIRMNPVPQPVRAKCVVCSLKKLTTIELKVKNTAGYRLCSDPCFAAYKYVNNIFPDQCTWCKKYFERKQSKCFTIYENTKPSCFCSKSCMNVFISNSRLIVPCNWCKVKKYNFDMIKRTQPSGQVVMMCSLNCLNLYQVSVDVVSLRSGQHAPALLDAAPADPLLLPAKRRRVRAPPPAPAPAPATPHELQLNDGDATRRGRGKGRAVRTRGGSRAAATLGRGGAAESPQVNTIGQHAPALLEAAPADPLRLPAKRRRVRAPPPAPAPAPATPHELQLNIVDCNNSVSYAWPADVSKDPLSFGSDHTNPSPVEDKSWNEPVSSPEDGGRGQSTPRKVWKLSQPKAPLPGVEIEFVDCYGSENDSGEEGSDAELSGFPMFVPRAQRLYLYPDEAPPLLVPPAAGGASTPPPPGSLEPTDMFKFDWRPSPDPPLPPADRREVFSETNCGPTAPFLTPYDAFVAIWDRQFMEYIATETNRYAQESMEKQLREGSLKPSSRIKEWKDTNADELYVYFALLVATGFCSKADLKEFWLQGGVLSTPNFAQQMTFRRFSLLARCLHFARDSPSLASLSRPEAKLHKIDPVVKYLNYKFQSLYRLGRDVVIDESLVQWKGWLDSKKYVKNKVESVGIKAYELSEAETGYLWRFKVHAGREEGAEREVTPVSGDAASLVLELLKGLQYRGHTVWMDHHYNSPALARVLKSLGFDCAGTVSTSRPAVPRQLMSLTTTMMAVGQVEGRTSGDVDVLVWRDRARVGVISTYHGAAVHTVGGKTKPVAVHDYDSCTSGLDRKDRYLNTFPIDRKRTLIWYKKLFKRLLNVSIFNAHILHKHSSVPEKLGRLSKHCKFRRELVAQLIERHDTRPIVYPSGAKTPQGRLRKPVPVLTPEVLEHFPAVYTCLSGNKKERMRRYCVLCRRRVQTYCPTCNVALCAFDCIKKYHQATNNDKMKHDNDKMTT